VLRQDPRKVLEVMREFPELVPDPEVLTFWERLAEAGRSASRVLGGIGAERPPRASVPRSRPDGR
jgi:hypothetical protein